MRKFVMFATVGLFSGVLFAGAALEDLDANKYGTISADEAKAQPELAKSFDALDQNKDGKLSAAEFAQFEMAPAIEQQVEQVMPETPAAHAE